MKSYRITTPYKILFRIFLLLFVSFCCYGDDEPTLKDAFQNHYYMGAALSKTQIMGLDAAATEIITTHFNSITAENILKWESVHPSPGKFDFEPADAMIALAEQHKMFSVGHTLIWHSQTPDWVFQDSTGNPVERDTLLARMKHHIFTVAGRYKDRVNGWDVLNEALEDNGRYRQSKWFKIIGEDYIYKAFRWADEASPNSELYYNDYNLWIPEKRAGTILLVKALKAKGIRIDGVGMQGHWGLDYPPLEELEASITAFAALGVKVMITELDLNYLPNKGDYTGADISKSTKLQKELNPYENGLPDSVQAKVTSRYAELFKILNKYSDVITRVTFWGVHDGQSWLNNWPVRGRTAYPLLFDRNYQPKPAFDAVIETVKDPGI